MRTTLVPGRSSVLLLASFLSAAAADGAFVVVSSASFARRRPGALPSNDNVLVPQQTAVLPTATVDKLGKSTEKMFRFDIAGRHLPERIRALAIIRYTNLRFTYLLTWYGRRQKNKRTSKRFGETDLILSENKMTSSPSRTGSRTAPRGARMRSGRRRCFDRRTAKLSD